MGVGVDGIQLPPITSFEYSQYFRKNTKRLRSEIEEGLKALICELQNGSLSKGRKLKKAYGCYVARINQNYRLAFVVHNNGAVEFICIDTHDEAYRYLRRR